MIALNRSVAGCRLLLKFATVCAAVVFWILVVLAVIAAGGCSMTPNQQYRVDASLYNGASIGLTAAHAKGDISDAKWDKLSGIMKEAKSHLSDARAWLTENPNLANVPGYTLPALDPAGVAIGILLNYAGAWGVDLVPIDPPATPPATPPAAPSLPVGTQPASALPIPRFPPLPAPRPGPAPPLPRPA